MAEPRETVYDLLAVFVILFVTLVLTANFGIVQLYYPSIILWALMPFIVELAVRKGSIRNLGFQKTDFRKSLPLTFGLILFWLLAFLLIPQGLGKAPLPAGFLVFVASYFFHPGLVEELCFRGFLQTRLERLFSVKKALVVQAAIFGLYHLPQVFSGSPGWLVLGGSFYPFIAFVFGIVMGIVYIKTRNLFVGIGVHASALEFFLLGNTLGAR